MFKHTILALALVTFGFVGGATVSAAEGCCCGKDAKCCQSAADHKCCGDEGQKCACCDHDGGHGGHGDPDARGGDHA